MSLLEDGLVVSQKVKFPCTSESEKESHVSYEASLGQITQTRPSGIQFCKSLEQLLSATAHKNHLSLMSLLYQTLLHQKL